MTVTAAQIASDLRNLGIGPGMVLLVHSSLKSLGNVDGGAKAVIAALQEVLTPEGTLVLPTLSYNEIGLQQRRFNVRTTKCCVGLIPETFRQMPGVIRSLHPTHSLAAWGCQAVTLLQGHEKQTSPGGIDSPYHRIIQAGGLILFLGTGIACNTMLHTVEELSGIGLDETIQPLEVVDYDSWVLPVPQHRHKGGHSEYYAKMEPFFLSRGIMKIGQVAAARCHLIDAARMERYVTALLKVHPDLFTHQRVDML